MSKKIERRREPQETGPAHRISSPSHAGVAYQRQVHGNSVAAGREKEQGGQSAEEIAEVPETTRDGLVHAFCQVPQRHDRPSKGQGLAAHPDENGARSACQTLTQNQKGRIPKMQPAEPTMRQSTTFL